MTDVFREKQGNLTEEDVVNATGFDMSFREGSMTREQKDFMKLRQDVYEGQEISIEPHIKLKAAKGVPAYQRLHFLLSTGAGTGDYRIYRGSSR